MTVEKKKLYSLPSNFVIKYKEKKKKYVVGREGILRHRLFFSFCLSLSLSPFYI